MKAHCLLLGIILTVFSAYGQKTFIVEADIRNMTDSLVIGCGQMKGSTARLMANDFVTMVNGKFKITREIEQTTKMFLHINNTGYQFWAKPGANLKITGEAPYVQTWLTESDIPIPEQIELNRFRETTREDYLQIHELKKEVTKLYSEANGNDSIVRRKSDSLRLKVNYIHNEVILYKELQLMLNNPITQAGMEELRNAAKNYKEGKLQKQSLLLNNILELAGLNNINDTDKSKARILIMAVYNKLSDKQKQSQLGQEIISLLSISSIVKTGDRMYDTELKDIEGNVHRLSDYKGKYILLDFWSRSCGPCIDALPELEKIAKKYEGKVVVISISVDPVSVWKEEAAKKSVTNWLQLTDGLESSGIAAHYEVKSLPTFVYISPEGIVLNIKKGYRNNVLSEEVKSMINDKQTN